MKGRYNKIQTKQIKHLNEQSVNQIKFEIFCKKTVEKAIFYNKIQLSGKQQHIFYVNLLLSTDTKADVA